uniref:SCA7 domain-containing protein n=1 Tax=Schistocephalus solidus TaxID=70667 RepID=A0A0X3PAV0_SCHSO
MANPWEAICKELSLGTTCSIQPLSCFNSVKVDGLESVKPDFVPSDRLLACKMCGVIFLQDQMTAHYGQTNSCLNADPNSLYLLPYNAISICQKKSESAQNTEKNSSKRLKTVSLRKSKSFRPSPNQDSTVTSKHKSPELKRKRTLLKKAATNSSPMSSLVDRDKISSSSSCERLSFGELNSPASPGTESSNSAPSKITEQPIDILQKYSRKGLMEILLEETATLSKSNRPTGSVASSLNLSGHLSSPASASHPQSYPSSPSHVTSATQKERIKNSKRLNKERKPTSNRAIPATTSKSVEKTLPSGHLNSKTSISQEDRRFTSQYGQEAVQAGHVRLDSSVKGTLDMTTGSLTDTIDLISDDSTEIDANGETSETCARSDEISEAVYHLKKDSSKHQRNMIKQKNGFNMFVSDYLNDVSEQTWGHPGFLINNGHWSSNEFLPNSDTNYLHDGVKFGDSTSNIRLHEKRSRVSESLPVSESWRDNLEGRSPNIFSPCQRSTNTVSAPFGRTYSQNLTGPRGGNMTLESFGNQEETVSLLSQCSCVKIDDFHYKNSAICAMHTTEEKRRVMHQHDLKVLMRQARSQQQWMRHCRNANSARRAAAAAAAATVQKGVHMSAATPASSWVRAATDGSASARQLQRQQLGAATTSTAPGFAYLFNPAGRTIATTNVTSTSSNPRAPVKFAPPISAQCGESGDSTFVVGRTTDNFRSTQSPATTAVSVLRAHQTPGQSSTSLPNAPFDCRSFVGASGVGNNANADFTRPAFSEYSYDEDVLRTSVGPHPNPPLRLTGDEMPTILHRKVHPSSMLRRNPYWMNASGANRVAASDGFNYGNQSAAAIRMGTTKTPACLSSGSQHSPIISTTSASSSSRPVEFYSHGMETNVIPGDLGEFQRRVVVNDFREKSITGRSRKSSRSSFRQTATAATISTAGPLRGSYIAGQLQSGLHLHGSSAPRPAVLLRTSQAKLRDSVGRLISYGQLRTNIAAGTSIPDLIGRAHYVVNPQLGATAAAKSVGQQKGTISAANSVLLHQTAATAVVSQSSVSISPEVQPTGGGNGSTQHSISSVTSANAPPSRYILIGAKSLKKATSAGAALAGRVTLPGNHAPPSVSPSEAPDIRKLGRSVGGASSSVLPPSVSSPTSSSPSGEQYSDLPWSLGGGSSSAGGTTLSYSMLDGQVTSLGVTPPVSSSRVSLPVPADNAAVEDSVDGGVSEAGVEAISCTSIPPMQHSSCVPSARMFLFRTRRV